MFSSKELEKLHLQLKRLVDPKKIENWQVELTRLEEDNATALKLHNENINGPLMEIVFGPAGGTETWKQADERQAWIQALRFLIKNGEKKFQRD